MSSLRRRLSGTAKSAPTEDSPAKAEQVRLAPESKIIDSQHPKSLKRRNGLIFFLGGLFGIVVAGFFAGQSDLIDFPELGDLSMDSLMDVLPASFVRDARDLVQGERDAVNYDSFAVGLNLVAQGFKAEHPVIMIPGVISTGLESWGTTNSSRQYFRKRLWGSWSMMRALVLDKESWKNHIMLDKKTGLDPEGGIKLRAAQGFDAADFFITGYWIWSKILENLATIGYDPTNSFTAAYDWRLSYANLEVRDQYFTRLKIYIEMACKVSGEKAVLISHSMGGQVLFYFFHWVASADGGAGGDDWVDKHVDSWINISGCLLGALKGLPAVLSGEMKDTAQLNAFAIYGLEKFLGREERADIFRAMPGISSMLPIGGNTVWGNHTWAPDDLPGQKVSFGPILNFRNVNGSRYQNLTVDDSLEYLMNNSEPWYQDMVKGSYSHGIAHTTGEVEANEKDPRKWINPLETRLPLAPNLKIYCFYGIGKPTERSYFYRQPETPLLSLNITIDTTLTQDNIDHGVIMGEGDGTVNLLSNGYMCNQGWNMHRYNPAGVKVKVYEMPHEPDRFSPRGGPKTGDHVDILGRQSLNDLILRVAAGKGDEIGENVVSDIKTYADRIDIREEPEYL
ncbi:Phospholipid:diacylglycerol acyltransferase [Lachnellula hyalina]|uniref:Phospholipid:diacylglycerol acyltransferase n=1 Tax=Lachnellula hyalina TaxID=1316788 RepID=A0A8H8QXI7_9HELO|nr:Phospholipid:diacylglycerol acyltransferase [Lachnellula hyalina]TVY24528.1 Phospholipid:diacylglycerol acyltransferase [Lachnellula hyalina]